MGPGSLPDRLDGFRQLNTWRSRPDQLAPEAGAVSSAHRTLIAHVRVTTGSRPGHDHERRRTQQLERIGGANAQFRPGWQPATSTLEPPLGRRDRRRTKRSRTSVNQSLRITAASTGTVTSMRSPRSGQDATRGCRRRDWPPRARHTGVRSPLTTRGEPALRRPHRCRTGARLQRDGRHPQRRRPPVGGRAAGIVAVGAPRKRSRDATFAPSRADWARIGLARRRFAPGVADADRIVDTLPARV